MHYNVTENITNTFMHLRRGNTDVISIRGTSSAAEALQDINFFAPAVFLQLANKMGLNLLDMRVMLNLFTNGVTEYRQQQLRSLTEYVGALVNHTDSDGALFLTGHSLG